MSTLAMSVLFICKLYLLIDIHSELSVTSICDICFVGQEDPQM